MAQPGMSEIEKTMISNIGNKKFSPAVLRNLSFRSKLLHSGRQSLTTEEEFSGDVHTIVYKLGLLTYNRIKLNYFHDTELSHK